MWLLPVNTPLSPVYSVIRPALCGTIWKNLFVIFVTMSIVYFSPIATVPVKGKAAENIDYIRTKHSETKGLYWTTPNIQITNFLHNFVSAKQKFTWEKRVNWALLQGVFFWPSLNLTKSQAHHKFLDLWNWGEGQLKGTQGFLRCLFKSGANPVKKGIFPNILLSKFIFLVLTSKTCFGFIDFLPLHKHKN